MHHLFWDIDKQLIEHGEEVYYKSETIKPMLIEFSRVMKRGEFLRSFAVPIYWKEIFQRPEFELLLKSCNLEIKRLDNGDDLFTLTHPRIVNAPKLPPHDLAESYAKFYSEAKVLNYSRAVATSWREEALEAAAQIALKYGCEDAAKEIKDLKSK